MTRTKPIPKRRAKPRRGSLRCPEYRAWLRKHGWCAVCYPHDSLLLMLRQFNPECLLCVRANCDPADTENVGMSMKGPDSSYAPLCREHHRAYDSDRKAFELKYGLSMKEVATAWWNLWQRRSG